jgi:hypothetical protein
MEDAILMVGFFPAVQVRRSSQHNTILGVRPKAKAGSSGFQ